MGTLGHESILISGVRDAVVLAIIAFVREAALRLHSVGGYTRRVSADSVRCLEVIRETISSYFAVLSQDLSVGISRVSTTGSSVGLCGGVVSVARVGGPSTSLSEASASLAETSRSTYRWASEATAETSLRASSGSEAWAKSSSARVASGREVFVVKTVGQAHAEDSSYNKLEKKKKLLRLIFA